MDEEQNFFKTIRVQDGLLYLIAFLLIKWLASKGRQWSKKTLPLPPSPPGYPLIGNLRLSRTDMRQVFRRLTNEYGGIFSLHLGRRLMVVVSGMEEFKEVFVTHGEAFSDRAYPPIVKYMIGIEGCLVFDNGLAWKARRRFGLRAMRSLGMGKKSMEHRIAEEARILCDSFESKRNVDFNPKRLITNAVANVICSVSFGFRYDYDDPIFQKLILKIHTGVTSLSFFSPVQFFFPLVHTPFYSDFRNLIYSIKNLTQQIVDEHRRSFHERGQSVDENEFRDFIDLYLLEISGRKERGDDIFSEDMVWRGLFSLFLAGSGTTSSTLLWAILLMAKFPDVMKEVHEEIDRIVGDHRSPSMSDQEAMPFTTATIMEIQRFRPVLTNGVLRLTNRDVDVLGYHVPKGTAVMMNLWEVLQSPKYWNEPEKFNPRRFLSKDGKTVLTPEAFIPFGIGHRSCLGELLTKMELFIYMSSLLQRFSFRLADGSRDVGLEGRAGFTLAPQEYEVRIDVR